MRGEGRGIRGGAGFGRLLPVFGYGFGVAKLREEGEHFFGERGCCSYRVLWFPGIRVSYFLDLHLAVLVILQGDRYFHVMSVRDWGSGGSMVCKP